MKIRPSQAGIHVFNRRSGLNVLLDEFITPPEHWAAAPRYVSIALTNACDLHCSYCYAPKDKERLGAEALGRWIGELDLNGCLGVGFGGGEPTLHPDFVAICRSAATQTDLAVTFTTHAHRLDDKLLYAVAGCVHFVRVSMDGVGITYEALRGRSFAALVSRIAELRSIAPFGINYVVNSQTIGDLNAAAEFAASSGASSFLILPERPTAGRPGIDNKTTTQLQTWVHHYRGRLPLSVSEDNAEGLPIVNPLSDESGLRAYAHVSATGILKESSFHRGGVAIEAAGLVPALAKLRSLKKEKMNEDLV